MKNKSDYLNERFTVKVKKSVLTRMGKAKDDDGINWSAYIRKCINEKLSELDKARWKYARLDRQAEYDNLPDEKKAEIDLQRKLWNEYQEKVKREKEIRKLDRL